ncbi:DUF3857 and transglutaminase domain-containing protein [Psychroflexus sp. YR1-1]|uniref:DUF3857 and transglutaminase domain-containing protein n=1 Tax=Psychroflexus aurantiacus TaxID=2709310 RepID=A0A6B3QYH5_9FLAO|nr:DUF3857 domain-containing protein [Psychroflexus aurantiacus]NEV93236.1 DUF3857 and transglutaminase domain-containing protein [Psychroflexus aurantiacus]
MKNLFLSLTILYCSFFYGQDDYSIVNLDSNLIEHANSVILSQDIVLEIDSYNSMTYTESRTVTILNKKGLSAINAYAYYDESTKIKNLTLTVYNTFGAELQKFKERDFEDVSVVGSVSLYSDNRVKYLSYTPSSYPITLLFEKEVKTSNTAFIRSFQPIITYDQSIKRSTYKIQNHSGETLRTYFNKYSENVSQKELDENTVMYSFENLEAVPREVYSPSLETYTPQVMFALNTFELEGEKGQGNNWDMFGKWQYENLLKGLDELPQSTVTEIQSLTAGLQTDVEKAKVVYDYVQKNTRYISVQVGIGGWKPISAAEVDAKKYGDCKGLTNYTKALLTAVGVQSNYCVVQAGSEIQDLEEEFTSLQGNHVILTIPQENQENIWLECTSQDIPFNFLGTFTDNRKVLAVKSTGGEIIKTPSFSEEHNYQFTSAEIILKGSSIEAEVKISSKGSQYYRKYGLKKENPKTIKSHFKSYWDNLKELKIENYKFVNHKDKIIFEEFVSIKNDNYLKLYGEDIIMDVNPFNKFENNIPNYAERKTPFLVERGFVDEDEFIFNIEGLSVETVMDDINFESEFGTYSLHFEVVNEKLIVKRFFKLNKNNYEKSTYQDFVDFFSTIKKFDNTKISLKQIKT